MAFHKVGLGDPALPSDVNQYAEVFAGEADVGTLRLASPIDAPDTVGVGVPIIGFDLEVGTYQYAMTYVTGIRLTDGNVEVSGETELGPSWVVETTVGNQRVELTSLPSPVGKPTVVAKRLYRTTVDGTEFRLVTTLGPGVSSYIDQTPDDDLGDVAPTENTTGTKLALGTNMPTVDEVVADLQSQIANERNRMLGIVAEQNLHIWQLESQLLKTQEGFKDFVGEPFLTSTSFVESVDGYLGISRSPYLSAGVASAFHNFGMKDYPDEKELWDVFPGLTQSISTPCLSFGTDPDTGVEYAVFANARESSKLDDVYVYKRGRGELSWTPVPNNIKQPYASYGLVLTEYGRCVALTKDARFLAVATANNPSLGYNTVWLYQRQGDEFVFLESRNLGMRPDMEWSPDGAYLAVISRSTKGDFRILRRSGTSFSTVFPQELPNSSNYTLHRVAWHPSGKYLSVSGLNGNNDWSNINVYENQDGSFVLLNREFGDRNSVSIDNVAWNEKFMVFDDASAKVYLVDADAGTFTLVEGHNLPRPHDALFTPDGKYLFIRAGTTLSLWKVDGTTFTQIPGAIDLGEESAYAGTNNKALFSSSDGTFVFLARTIQSARMRAFTGGSSSATAEYASFTLTPKQLASTSNKVYVLADYDVPSGNIDVRFYASLNGGTTWDEVELGRTQTLSHSGTQLTVKVEFHRPGGGLETDRANVYWVAAYAL